MLSLGSACTFQGFFLKMSQTYLTLLRLPWEDGILLDLRLRARCLHPEVQAFIQLGWRGACPARTLCSFRSAETGQATAEAALPSARAPGVPREGRGWEARWLSPWWALLSPHLAECPAWRGSAGIHAVVTLIPPQARQLGGAFPAFHTHQGQGAHPTLRRP